MNNEIQIVLDFLEERKIDCGFEMNEVQKLIDEGKECEEDYLWLQILIAQNDELYVIISFIKDHFQKSSKE
jgi:hypothetical protein